MNSFKYLGHTFTPHGKLPENATLQSITLNCSNIGAKYSNHEGKYSYAEFIKRADDAGLKAYDLFLMDGKTEVLPCQNQLFKYTGKHRIVIEDAPGSFKRNETPEDKEKGAEASQMTVAGSFQAKLRAKKTSKRRKVVICLEVEIDESKIAKKYPNFAINYATQNGKPTKQALIDFASRFVEEEEDSMKDFGFAVKIVSSQIAPTLTPKMVMIDEQYSCARALSFGRTEDPYVIVHPEGAEKLDDKVLRDLYRSWREKNADAFPDTEDFEKFLGELEKNKGYQRLPTRFELIEF